MKRLVLLVLIGSVLGAPVAGHAKLQWPFAIVVSNGTLEEPVRLPNAVVDSLLPDNDISVLFQPGEAPPPVARARPFIVRISMRAHPGAFMTLRYHRGTNGARSVLTWDNGPMEFMYPATKFERALRNATRSEPVPRPVVEAAVVRPPARAPVALAAALLLVGLLGVVVVRARVSRGRRMRFPAS